MSATSRRIRQTHPAEDLDGQLYAIAKGDTQAFANFYRLTRRMVFSVCLRICPDHAAAEDACAEVYILIWQNADKFDRDRGTAITWVSTIARNKALSCVRKNRFRYQFDAKIALEAESPVIDGNVIVLANERAKFLERRLRLLAGSHKMAIRSAFYQGMTYPEIAARSNVPLGTVKSWVRRGLANLRGDLQVEAANYDL